ncbi:hypothetical protein QTP88_019648 [Uroleucon formosanum]
MDDDQIRLLIKNIDDGNTEFDEIDGSDEEGVDEVEYIEYLKCLLKALIYKYMLERVQIKNIPMNIKVRIREITNAIKELVQKTSNSPERCAFCNWKKNRKTSNLCNECQSYICKEHTAPSICQNCS